MRYDLILRLMKHEGFKGRVSPSKQPCFLSGESRGTIILWSL